MRRRQTAGPFSSMDWRVLAADRGPDMLVVLDESWIVRYVSEDGALPFTIVPAEVVGNPMPLDVIHPDDLDYALGAIAETERRVGDHSPAQLRLLGSDGGWHQVEIAVRTSVEPDTGRRWHILAVRRLALRDEPPLRRQELERMVQRVTGDCAAAGPDEIERVVDDALCDLGLFLHADTILLGLVDHDLGVLRFEFEWSASPHRSWRALRPYLPLDQLQWDATEVPDRGYRFTGELAELTRGDPALLRDYGVTSLVDVVVASHGKPVSVLTAMFCDDAWYWDDAHATLVRMLGEILTVTIQRLGDYRRLQHRTLHDSLTGLPNRDHLVKHLREARGESTILFCDLDGFKAVNDRWGHDCGDDVLIEVAGRLRQLLRPGDIAARLGGDEFVVVCTPESEHDAQARARGIDDAVRGLDRIGAATFTLSASVGVAHYRAGDPIEAALQRADAGMYTTKRVRRESRIERHRR